MTHEHEHNLENSVNHPDTHDRRSTADHRHDHDRETPANQMHAHDHGHSHPYEHEHEHDHSRNLHHEHAHDHGRAHDHDLSDLSADTHDHSVLTHDRAHKHHSHSHSSGSQHIEGHHLLQVENLSIGFVMYDSADRSFFRAKKREVSVIKNLNISVHAGEILAIIGASGSGKTLLADAIMGIFEPNAVVSGRIWFDGVLQNAETLPLLRGRGISLVPQSVNYLDPLMKTGKQVSGFKKASLRKAERHYDQEESPDGMQEFDSKELSDAQVKSLSGSQFDKKARKKEQDRLFAHYSLNEQVNDLYPFEISGGMARRVLLSTALIDEPQLIIADEPTPGLDLDLAVKAMADFREFADLGKGVLLITHDIELALRVADRVAVFKDGTVVEETAVANFASPDLLEHPFSRELWHALPEHDFIAGNGGDSC